MPRPSLFAALLFAVLPLASATAQPEGTECVETVASGVRRPPTMEPESARERRAHAARPQAPDSAEEAPSGGAPKSAPPQANTASAARPIFSGRWQQDKAKSANLPPDMEHAQGVTALVQQSSEEFTVQYRLETPGAPTGDYSIQWLTYPFAPPESTAAPRASDATWETLTARWVEGDKELELIFTRLGELRLDRRGLTLERPRKTRKERWRLAGDVLTIRATIEIGYMAWPSGYIEIPEKTKEVTLTFVRTPAK